MQREIMDVQKVDTLISTICDDIASSGANLIEAHQALKSVDAAVRAQILERTGVRVGRDE